MAARGVVGEWCRGAPGRRPARGRSAQRVLDRLIERHGLPSSPGRGETLVAEGLANAGELALTLGKIQGRHGPAAASWSAAAAPISRPARSGCPCSRPQRRDSGVHRRPGARDPVRLWDRTRLSSKSAAARWWSAGRARSAPGSRARGPRPHRSPMSRDRRRLLLEPLDGLAKSPWMRASARGCRATRRCPSCRRHPGQQPAPLRRSASTARDRPGAARAAREYWKGPGRPPVGRRPVSRCVRLSSSSRSPRS